MKFIKVFCCLVFLLLFGKQDSKGQSWLWAKQGIARSNNTYDLPYSITTDKSGNVFATGIFADSLDFGPFHLYMSGTEYRWYSFMVKYDSSGNILWAKQSGAKDTGTFSNVNLVNANSNSTDAVGNIYETGYFHGSVYFDTFNLSTTAYSYGNVSGDVYLLKRAPNGNVLWAKSADAPTRGGSGSTCVINDSRENTIMTGYFFDSISFGSTLLTTNTADEFLVKYDSIGNVIWAKQSSGDVGNFAGVYGVKLTVDNKNNIFEAGLFSDTIIFGTYIFTTPNYMQTGGYLMKFDSSGNILWGINISGDSIQYNNVVTTDISGNVYIALSYSGNISFGSNSLHSSIPAIMLAKCNPIGNVLWVKNLNCLSSPYNINPFSFSSDSNYHLYLSGVCYGSTLIIPPDTYLNANNFLVKLDTAGYVMCSSALVGDVNLSFATCDASGKHVYLTNSVEDTYINIGSTRVGPGGGYTYTCWPFVARWTGCDDNNFDVLPLANNPSCKYKCNGTANANPSGGTPPYTYLWSTSPPQASQIATGLCVGTYSVTVTDFTGNQITRTTIVTPKLNYSIHAKDSICAGMSDSVKTSGFTAISWTPSTGLSCTNCTNPIAFLDSTITYIIKAIDTAGCLDTVTCTVYVFPLPSISPPSDICQGTYITLTAKGGTSYLWNNGETCSSIIVTPVSATTYTVKVNVANYVCTDTLSTTIITRLSPTAYTCCDTIIIPGASVQLSAAGEGSFLWVPSSGLSCDTCSNPIASPSQTTTYTLTVTNDSGCAAQSFVTIDVSCGNVFIPTAFSPNQYNNKILYVRGLCIATMDFMVFDRWGNKVFESQNPDIGWDGTYKGQPMNMGTYMWVLKANMLDGTTIEKSGNVALVK